MVHPCLPAHTVDIVTWVFLVRPGRVMLQPLPLPPGPEDAGPPGVAAPTRQGRGRVAWQEAQTVPMSTWRRVSLKCESLVLTLRREVWDIACLLREGLQLGVGVSRPPVSGEQQTWDLSWVDGDI